MADRPLPSAPLWVAAASRVIRGLPAGRYRATRLFAKRRGRFWARLPADLGGLWFQCDLRDGLMREVYLTGRYEPAETCLTQAILQPGDTFVDVGANWGYFTLTGAALVGALGRVVSVEADPRACRVLGENVSRNTLRHVTVLHAAAHDAEGLLTLEAYDHEGDDSSNFGVVRVSSESRAASRRVDVTAQPLDSLLDEAGVHRIDLLKMDIEGAEARALAGLSRRLSAGSIDRVILEVHPEYLRQQGSSAAAVVARLHAHGFHAWIIDHTAAAYRRAAASVVVDPRTFLTKWVDGAELGPWPHLLWARAGVQPTRQPPEHRPQ